jgi:hypothetical protein
MFRWEFTPYNRDEWNKAEERILFVASEPNGDNPNSGILDMGDWFRTATPENNYHGNPQFFNRSLIMLNGINGKSTNHAYVKHDEDFSNFRFMDLKATQGGPIPGPNVVLNFVLDHLNEVTKYFNSPDADFGLSPQIIVLLGNTAQSVFTSCIRKQVINDKNLKWIGMPHPSAQIGYEGLEYASTNIRQHLKSINQQAKKWVYHKDWTHHMDDKDYGWRSI